MKRSPRSEMDSELESVDRASSQPASTAPGAGSDLHVEEMAAQHSNLAVPARKVLADYQPSPESSQDLGPKTDIELQEQLQILAKMFRQGQEDQARARYESLKRQHPDHDLPQTLEEALAEALAEELGDIPAENPDTR